MQKYLAENYIPSNLPSDYKKVYVLRPPLICGDNNKGNLKLLFKLVNFRFPWIFSSFNNFISI